MANELHTLNLNGTNYPIRPYSFQLAENTITTTTDDKPSTWGGLGCTVHFYSSTNQLNQPKPGYVLNLVNVINTSVTMAYQLLMDPASGEMYRRSGVVGAAWSKPWKKIINEDDLSTGLSTKQDTLVSGTNIATINSNSILGSGNFDLATTAQLRDYQPKLVSGTNIKTINNESIVGGGNLTIQTNLKYIHTSNASTGTINISLQPNACVYLVNGVGSGTTRTTLNITAPSSNNTLISSTNNGDLIESSIIFSIPNGASPAIVFDLDIDNNSSSDMSIKWVNDTPPTFTAGKTYEINFIYPATSGVGLGLGAWVAF